MYQPGYMVSKAPSQKSNEILTTVIATTEYRRQGNGKQIPDLEALG